MTNLSNPQTREIIRLEDLSVSLGGRDILDQLSLRIHLSEFVYVVGRTGAGKSTLLKVLYADCPISFGSVFIGNRAVHSISPAQVPFLRRKLGIVFQDFQLLPDRNVYQNIRFALRATGWSDKVKIKRKISEVLLMVGMAGHSRSMPHQLSGGEQQRVAIARALINDPLVLLADEPTGNLDPEATEEVMQILLKINQSGTAILMATHEYRILRQYPSRVLEVHDTKLTDYASAADFLKGLSIS